jgi:colanic acid biosynthesis glycosyl transferase WcaI
MRILLYGINFSPELTGCGKYTGEFARWCAQEGYEVRVVTAPAYYPDWKVGAGFSARKYQRTVEEGVVVLRCPLYVPSRPSAAKRMLHLLSFSLTSSMGLFANVRWKPDLVIQIAPTLACAPWTWLFSRLTRARSVLHIQDFEVDAMIGLSMTDGDVLKRLARGLERMILRSYDRVSTISRHMVQRAADKGVDPTKLILFPNWSELERFQDVPNDSEYLAGLGVDPDKKLVLYSGSMGEKQGLEAVIEAASRFRDRPSIQFLLVGDGSTRADLMDEVKRRSLENVLFAPVQSYDSLPILLAAADCHLVVQRRGAADSVLPSKLTNILAVGGNAVITADPETSLGELTREWPGIACLVEPESVSALVAGINEVLQMAAPNTTALDYASKHLDKHAVLEAFLANFSSDPGHEQRRPRLSV